MCIGGPHWIVKYDGILTYCFVVEANILYAHEAEIES